MAQSKRYLPADSREPVDEVLPTGRLALLGMQHVMVMYTGAIAVPLIIGMALKLPKDQVTYLISVDLFVSGLVTLIQSVGFRSFGIRLPIMMGVTFTSVGPMIAIASNPALGLPGIFGSMICSGIVGLLAAPLMAKLLRFFPPVVIGTEILVVTKYFNGFVRNIAVLLGIVFGMGLTAFTGTVDFSAVHQAAWFGMVMPFHFGAPKFDLWSSVAMSIVMLVTFIEATGMFVAVGEMTGKPVDAKQMANGFRADAAGTLLGAFFNIFPYTSYAENIGLVSITGVRSRWVCAVGAVLLMIMGLVPKMSALVASVPACVLGGAGLIMFGMIAACGVRILGQVDFTENRFNAYIVAISVSVGLLPVVNPDFFNRFPQQLAPLLHSSILLAAVTAVVLNLFFNLIRGSKAEKATFSAIETVQSNS